MKATMKCLLAVAAAALFASAGMAQDSIVPVKFGGRAAADCGCGGDSGCASGACSDRGCRGNRQLFASSTVKCGKAACGHKCCLFGWLCSPLPSNAPACHRPNYPLGFPNSPYVRSPRDYFMGGQCGCNGAGAAYGYANSYGIGYPAGY